MSEMCPMRSTTTEGVFDGNKVGEPYIPSQCMSCIASAEHDVRTSKVESDTYEASFAAVRESSGDHTTPADSWDRWRAVSMSLPQGGIGRVALVETGFDTNAQHGFSYEIGTESTTTEMIFECYQEKIADDI